MAKENGSEGAATFNSASMYITGWTLTRSEPALDTTDDSHAGWRTRIAKGISDWTAVINGHFDTAGTMPAVGDSASLVLTRSSGNTYTGTALVESIELSVDVPGETPNQYTINFAGNGALT